MSRPPPKDRCLCTDSKTIKQQLINPILCSLPVFGGGTGYPQVALPVSVPRLLAPHPHLRFLSSAGKEGEM